MSEARRVRLFRNGAHQVLRIPRDLELLGRDAILRKEGDRLIIEPARVRSLLEVLAALDPIEEGLPDVDTGLLPLDDVTLSPS